jgi:hypothetical protein
MDDAGGNGRFHGDEELDDDAPLSAEEAEEAATLAEAQADETLDERVEAVVEELAGVDRRREGEAVSYLAGGRTFAVQAQDVLEVALDADVAMAALRTPDAKASSRGPDWIAFAPEIIDRFALDRAEAWLRAAHRRVTGG